MLILNESAQYPVSLLEENEIFNICGKPEQQINIEIGYCVPVKISSRFNGDVLNPETNKPYPEIKVVKCIERNGVAGQPYSELDSVRARNATVQYQLKNIQRLINNQHRSDAGENIIYRGIQSWKIPNIIGENNKGALVFCFCPDTSENKLTQYYISKNNRPYKKCELSDIEQYMNPSDFNKLLTNSNPISYRTILLNNIYKLNIL